MNRCISYQALLHASACAALYPASLLYSGANAATLRGQTASGTHEDDIPRA